MTQTVIINNVPAEKLPRVLKDLQRDGYATSQHQESDGRYTVTGVRDLPDSSTDNLTAAKFTGVKTKTTKIKPAKTAATKITKAGK